MTWCWCLPVSTTDLRSQTQGRGTYFVEFDHYEGAPAQMTEKLVEEAKKAKAAENSEASHTYWYQYQ